LRLERMALRQILARDIRPKHLVFTQRIMGVDDEGETSRIMNPLERVETSDQLGRIGSELFAKVSSDASYMLIIQHECAGPVACSEPKLADRHHRLAGPDPGACCAIHGASVEDNFLEKALRFNL